MSIPKTRLRRLAMAASLAVAMIAAFLPTATPAQAATVEKKAWAEDNPDDVGGLDIHAYIRVTYGGPYHYLYTAKFNAYGETLTVRNNVQDGNQAVVDLKFYFGSELLEIDTYYCRAECTFDLGTPDGSGDVREDVRVVMKLSGGGYSTPWATGRA